MAQEAIPDHPIWQDRLTSRLYPLGQYTLLDIIQEVPRGGSGETQTPASDPIQTIAAFTQHRPFFYFINAPDAGPIWCLRKLRLFWNQALSDPSYAIPPPMMLAGGSVVRNHKVVFWTFQTNARCPSAGERFTARWTCRGESEWDWWADEFTILRFFFEMAENVNAIRWPARTEPVTQTANTQMSAQSSVQDTLVLPVHRANLLTFREDIISAQSRRKKSRRRRRHSRSRSVDSIPRTYASAYARGKLNIRNVVKQAETGAHPWDSSAAQAPGQVEPHAANDDTESPSVPSHWQLLSALRNGD